MIKLGEDTIHNLYDNSGSKWYACSSEPRIYLCMYNTGSMALYLRFWYHTSLHLTQNREKNEERFYIGGIEVVKK